MPVLLDLPAMFAAGSTLAWASRKHIESQNVRGESRVVKTATSFGIFYGLSVAFLCFWREAWMWHYLLLPPLPTILWYLMFWGALASAAWAGARLTQAALRTRSRGLARVWLFGPLVVLAGLAALLSDQYMHVGTLAEYQRGEAYSLLHTPNTLRVILLGGAISAVVLIVLVLWNRWLDRRVANGRPTAGALVNERNGTSEVASPPRERPEALAAHSMRSTRVASKNSTTEWEETDRE